MPIVTETNTTLELACHSKGLASLAKRNQTSTSKLQFPSHSMFIVKGIFEGIVCLPLRRDTANFFLFNKMLIPL